MLIYQKAKVCFIYVSEHQKKYECKLCILERTIVEIHKRKGKYSHHSLILNLESNFDPYYSSNGCHQIAVFYPFYIFSGISGLFETNEDVGWRQDDARLSLQIFQRVFEEATK